MSQARRERGMMVVEVTLSLVLALALLMAFTAAVAGVQRSEKKLAAERAMGRRLEKALVALESGQEMEEGIAVEKIGEAAPAGKMWVRARVKGMQNGVVGLVRENTPAEVVR